MKSLWLIFIQTSIFIVSIRYFLKILIFYYQIQKILIFLQSFYLWLSLLPFFNLKNKFSCFCIVGNIYLRFLIKYFDFIEWFGLNCSSNSLFKMLPMKYFLTDFLMCLYISLIAFLSLKFSSSGLVLIHLQPSSCPIAFCLFIS